MKRSNIFSVALRASPSRWPGSFWPHRTMRESKPSCDGRRAKLLVANYCRIQSAKAGPGLLLHVAASSVFDNSIVPLGHVTETSFSPGLHSRSHLASVSHLSRLSARRPPAGPGGCAPARPWSPLGPCGPARPWSPFAPCGPGGPCSPLGPCGPAGPWGPAGPSGPLEHPASEKAVTSAMVAIDMRIVSPRELF